MKSRTPEQWAAIVVIALAAVGFAVLLMTGLNRLLTRPAGVTAVADPAVAPGAGPAPAVPKIKATLYFLSQDGLHLVPTEREVPLAEGPVAQARSILEAQLSAEAPAPLISTIPKGSTLRGVYVSERNEVFVDLEPTIRTAHPGGTLEELMTVYTIVNAVLTNLPDLKEVQILIGGQEADTLAGHVDLHRPLKKNDALILASHQ
ncbi:MAG: GerMN domain-containing protein [Acidobacteriota bacterium]